MLTKHRDRSYIVQSEDGAKYWRNRVKIRPTRVPTRIRDQTSQRISDAPSSLHKPLQTSNGEGNPGVYTERTESISRNDEVLIMGRKDKMETGVDPEPIPGAPKQYTD